MVLVTDFDVVISIEMATSPTKHTIMDTRVTTVAMKVVIVSITDLLEVICALPNQKIWFYLCNYTFDGVEAEAPPLFFMLKFTSNICVADGAVITEH